MDRSVHSTLRCRGSSYIPLDSKRIAIAHHVNDFQDMI